MSNDNLRLNNIIETQSATSLPLQIEQTSAPIVEHSSETDKTEHATDPAAVIEISTPTDDGVVKSQINLLHAPSIQRVGLPKRLTTESYYRQTIIKKILESMPVIDTGTLRRLLAQHDPTSDKIDPKTSHRMLNALRHEGVINIYYLDASPFLTQFSGNVITKASISPTDPLVAEYIQAYIGQGHRHIDIPMHPINEELQQQSPVFDVPPHMRALLPAPSHRVTTVSFMFRDEYYPIQTKSFVTAQKYGLVQGKASRARLLHYHLLSLYQTLTPAQKNEEIPFQWMLSTMPFFLFLQIAGIYSAIPPFSSIISQGSPDTTLSDFSSSHLLLILQNSLGIARISHLLEFLNRMGLLEWNQEEAQTVVGARLNPNDPQPDENQSRSIPLSFRVNTTVTMRSLFTKTVDRKFDGLREKQINFFRTSRPGKEFPDEQTLEVDDDTFSSYWNQIMEFGLSIAVLDYEWEEGSSIVYLTSDINTQREVSTFTTLEELCQSQSDRRLAILCLKASELLHPSNWSLEAPVHIPVLRHQPPPVSYPTEHNWTQLCELLNATDTIDVLLVILSLMESESKRTQQSPFLTLRILASSLDMEYIPLVSLIAKQLVNSMNSLERPQPSSKSAPSFVFAVSSAVLNATTTRTFSGKPRMHYDPLFALRFNTRFTNPANSEKRSYANSNISVLPSGFDTMEGRLKFNTRFNIHKRDSLHFIGKPLVEKSTFTPEMTLDIFKLRKESIRMTMKRNAILGKESEEHIMVNWQWVAQQFGHGADASVIRRHYVRMREHPIWMQIDAELDLEIDENDGIERVNGVRKDLWEQLVLVQMRTKKTQSQSRKSKYAANRKKQTTKKEGAKKKSRRGHDSSFLSDTIVSNTAESESVRTTDVRPRKYTPLLKLIPRRTNKQIPLLTKQKKPTPTKAPKEKKGDSSESADEIEIPFPNLENWSPPSSRTSIAKVPTQLPLPYQLLNANRLAFPFKMAYYAQLFPASVPHPKTYGLVYAITHSPYQLIPNQPDTLNGQYSAIVKNLNTVYISSGATLDQVSPKWLLELPLVTLTSAQARQTELLLLLFTMPYSDLLVFAPHATYALRNQTSDDMDRQDPFNRIVVRLLETKMIIRYQAKHRNAFTDLVNRICPGRVPPLISLPHPLYGPTPEFWERALTIRPFPLSFLEMSQQGLDEILIWMRQMWDEQEFSTPEISSLEVGTIGLTSALFLSLCELSILSMGLVSPPMTEQINEMLDSPDDVPFSPSHSRAGLGNEMGLNDSSNDSSDSDHDRHHFQNSFKILLLRLGMLANVLDDEFQNLIGSAVHVFLNPMFVTNFRTFPVTTGTELITLHQRTQKVPIVQQQSKGVTKYSLTPAPLVPITPVPPVPITPTPFDDSDSSSFLSSDEDADEVFLRMFGMKEEEEFGFDNNLHSFIQDYQKSFGHTQTKHLNAIYQLITQFPETVEYDCRIPFLDEDPSLNSHTGMTFQICSPLLILMYSAIATNQEKFGVSLHSLLKTSLPLILSTLDGCHATNAASHPKSESGQLCWKCLFISFSIHLLILSANGIIIVEHPSYTGDSMFDLVQSQYVTAPAIRTFSTHYSLFSSGIEIGKPHNKSLFLRPSFQELSLKSAAISIRRRWAPLEYHDLHAGQLDHLSNTQSIISSLPTSLPSSVVPTNSVTPSNIRKSSHSKQKVPFPLHNMTFQNAQKALNIFLLTFPYSSFSTMMNSFSVFTRSMMIDALLYLEQSLGVTHVTRCTHRSSPENENDVSWTGSQDELLNQISPVPIDVFLMSLRHICPQIPIPMPKRMSYHFLPSSISFLHCILPLTLQPLPN
ncbi:hypothetical protein BLNAU_50 [Blattamonas nauphoetae]|uniref:GTF3C1 extended winged-helix domain-containing protein n=1 Tax=Blattamonas nauphoetae TaxID=2049346 RepID=A0ABQ9YLV9_9EUKA|nr:hypothetical protein BLNAU_50 [Blattamonas nauphoetae]